MKVVVNKKLTLRRFFLIDYTSNDFLTLTNNRGDVFYLDSLDKIDNPLLIESSSLTYIHDLSKVEDATGLYLSFNKTIRNSINWCRNNQVQYMTFVDSKITKDVINNFIKTCKITYKSKGMKAPINKKLIIDYAKNNSLTITCSKSLLSGEKVFHIYKLGKDRAILWYSCSSHNINKNEKNNIGKQNRYLHYMDMLFFKDNGIRYYDWGGLSRSNPNDSIALFKKSFENGEEKVVFSYKVMKTKKSKLFSKLHLV